MKYRGYVSKEFNRRLIVRRGENGRVLIIARFFNKDGAGFRNRDNIIEYSMALRPDMASTLLRLLLKVGVHDVPDFYI